MSLCLDVQKQLANFTLDIKLTCEPGTLTAIVGPSGAGKSTLVRIIAGLTRPDSGQVKLHDTVWSDSAARTFLPPQKRGLGLVFQDYTLFPHLTVRKNVAFAAREDVDIDALLKQFSIAHIAEQKPANISGGERQRAAFCQALARKPVLLLLDEPFSALDIATREALRTELKNQKEHWGIPIVHVTHDLEEAFYLADRIVAVENGHHSPFWLKRQLAHRDPRQNIQHRYFTKDDVCFDLLA